MYLVPFRRRHDPTKPGFLSLPTELRLKIYGYCFDDSHARYWREKLPRGGKLVKIAFCKGPKEHDLLVTCSQIYSEASPILIDSAYFLLDQTNAQTAFISIDYNIHHSLFSPWLTKVTQGTKRLVLSKPGVTVFWNSRPIFRNVEAIDMFGFYPTLQRWLKRDRTISLGWVSHSESRTSTTDFSSLAATLGVFPTDQSFGFWLCSFKA